MIHNFREMQGCWLFILFDSPFRDTTKIDRLFSIKSFYRATVSIAHRIEIHWTWRARRIRMHETIRYERGRKNFSWNLKTRFFVENGTESVDNIIWKFLTSRCVIIYEIIQCVWFENFKQYVLLYNEIM